MELALTAGLASLGYSLVNKNENFRDSKKKETSLSENNIPNSQELHNSNHLSKTSEKLRTRSATNWEDSKNPDKTNIIPANYNKDFQNLSQLNNDQNMQLYSSNYSSAVKEYENINNNEKSKQNGDFLEEFYAVNNHNDDVDDRFGDDSAGDDSAVDNAMMLLMMMLMVMPMMVLMMLVTI